MDWYHQVDPKWLAARKEFLCASDIVKLLPTTATGRKRANLDGAYLGVWASKQCAISDDDVVSRGAMARGHILESYAIAETNEQALTVPLNHWDDVLIERNGVSCSPDALDLPLPPDAPKVLTSVHAQFVGEVKAYNAAAHYEAGQTPRLELMERWQLATAFYVMPTISAGFIIFYNPSACHPIFIKSYDRSDLADELDMIEDIRAEYEAQATELSMDFDLTCASIVCVPESEIVKELEALQECGLNP